MSVNGNLLATLVVENPYKPYPYFNHHFTRIKINAEILGEITPLSNTEVYSVFNQGNNPSATPAVNTIHDGGTATSGSATSLNDTSKSWTTNQWAGKYCLILSGLSAGKACKIISNTNNSLVFSGSLGQYFSDGINNTSVYSIETANNLFYAQRNEFSDQKPGFFFPHNQYTVWTMARDQYGVAKVARNYIDVEAVINSYPAKDNSISPLIIGRSQDPFNSTHTVTVKATKGDTIRVYNIKQMNEDLLLPTMPQVDGGWFTFGGNRYVTIHGLAFRESSIASGIVTNTDGTLTITFNDDSSTYGTYGQYCASAETPGYGESFSNNFWSLSGSISECRQIRATFTPTTQTRNNPTSGVKELFHTIQCKQYDINDGTEMSLPTQSNFYFNYNNNGDAFNVPITDGCWLPIGDTSTILIVDYFGNSSTVLSHYTYYSYYVIVAGESDNVYTNFTSIADAISRGPNANLLKKTKVYYSTDFDVDSKVYVNNIDTDNTTVGQGFFYIGDLRRAIETDVSGTIIGKQIIAY